MILVSQKIVISHLKINILKKFHHQWNRRATCAVPLVVEFFKKY